MRATTIALAAAIALGSLPAFGHGPQIQITKDPNGEIITRRIMNTVANAYPDVLTPQTSVYVMPLTNRADGVWRAMPNNSRLPNGDPEFLGWPGFMYGHGYDTVSNPEPFPVGSRFILGFTDGLKDWNGSAFDDAGSTELEAYRGPSNAPTALAKTSDSGPFQNLLFPGAAGLSFTAEGNDTHNSIHFRMLGDGTSLDSPLADGIYLLTLQVDNNSASVTPSDPYFFVLHKDADAAELSEAVASLGFAADAVQVIPEPGALMLALAGMLGVCGSTRVGRRPNRR
jgi:hypothetical protein